MFRKIIVIVSLVFAVTAASAQERPKSYDPTKGVPAAAQQKPTNANAQARPADAKVNPGDAAAEKAKAIEAAKADAMRKAEEAARAEFAAWKRDKEACYISAGLSKESADFIVSPVNPLIYQIANRVWVQPSRYDLPKLRSCQ